MEKAADVAFPHLHLYFEHLPKIIPIGGFGIAYYGICIALGMLLGILLVIVVAKKTGQNPEQYLDYALYGILLSVAGARIYYVIFSWDRFKDHPLQIFNLRTGGLAIYGGVIVAIITAFIYCRIKKISFFTFADTAILGLITGQMIGRYGNFFNREVFGGYTDCLFAMRLRLDEVAVEDVTQAMRDHATVVDGVSSIQVHPTFLYESMWNGVVLIVLLLLTYWKKKKKFKVGEGDVFRGYLMGYGLGRLIIEYVRTDQLKIWNTNIPVSMVLSGFLLTVAGIWQLKVSLARKNADSTEVEKI